MNEHTVDLTLDETGGFGPPRRLPFDKDIPHRNGDFGIAQGPREIETV